MEVGRIIRISNENILRWQSYFSSFTKRRWILIYLGHCAPARYSWTFIKRYLKHHKERNVIPKFSWRYDNWVTVRITAHWSYVVMIISVIEICNKELLTSNICWDFNALVYRFQIFIELKNSLFTSAFRILNEEKNQDGNLLFPNNLIKFGCQSVLFIRSHTKQFLVPSDVASSRK